MRSRRASRPSRSNGTSNRPGPWPREATTGPRNASSGGCPCGPSISAGSGSSRRAWTRRNPASGTPRKGVYADIPLLAQKARNSLREARAHAAAEVTLRASDREAAREKRKGADVGRADTILAQGAEALEAKEYAKVRGFAKDAHDAVR